jgi:RNA polymerase sigma factor (TIGR02999 family)
MNSPNPPSPSDVTRILGEVRRGERNASSRLLPLVYEELRRLARARMAGLPPGQTLQPTALVHDAYLRLLGDEDVAWKDRAHFFGAAAMAMRDILVERARRRARIKHGGGMRRADLRESVAAPGDDQQVDVIALNEALRRLEGEDPRKSQIVMLRYFAGLSIENTAAALDLSAATIKREWNYARAWLLDAMSEEEHEPKRAGQRRTSA